MNSSLWNHQQAISKRASALRRSIAQGCSEYNITVLIDQRDSVRALRAVHGRFYLATLPLALGIVGPGLIGSTFLAQLHQETKVRFQASPVGPQLEKLECCSMFGHWLQIMHCFKLTASDSPRCCSPAVVQILHFVQSQSPMALVSNHLIITQSAYCLK